MRAPLATIVTMLSALATTTLAGQPPGLYILNYYNSTVMRVAPDGSRHVAWSAADGIDGPFGANAIALSPDGDLLIGNFNSHQVLRFPGGDVIADAGNGVDSPDGLVFSPDGRLIIANRDGRNLLVRNASGAVSLFDEGVGIAMSVAAAGPDLFVANSGGRVFRYDGFDPGTQTLLGTYGPGGNVAIAASPAGDALYYADEGVIVELNPETGAVVRSVASGVGHADEGLVFVPAFGVWPDRLLASDFAGAVYEVLVSSGEVHALLGAIDGLAGPSGVLWIAPDVDCAGFTRCDANCDGYVDNGDIDAFIAVLVDPAQYQMSYPACSIICNNDANGDLAVNNADIDAFVACLLGG